MALMGSINNPLSNQIIMNANKPKFQGTAENFSEFRRKWKEYYHLIKGNSPTTNESQILHLFHQCLDEGTALQLKREVEDNPRLTVAKFMTIMERDFGKDFSSQAREEWRQIKLNGGKNVTSKEWRMFRMQWEIAARRSRTKGKGKNLTCSSSNFRHIGSKRW